MKVCNTWDSSGKFLSECPMLFIISTYFVGVFLGLCARFSEGTQSHLPVHKTEDKHTEYLGMGNCPFIHFIHGSIENGEIFVTDEIGKYPFV